MKRIPPSERISRQIKETISSLHDRDNNQEIIRELILLGTKMIVQEILEHAVEEYLERGYYEHKKNGKGYRNGYKRCRIKTEKGTIKIEKPQVSDTEEKFHLRLWNHLKEIPEELEQLAIEMYARGCSTRDIEEILKDNEGNPLLSKSKVSELNERLWQAYEEFCKQDLSQYEVVYLFADAVYEAMRVYKTVKEGILVVWAILEDGKKILLGMRLGNKESYEDWLDFFRDLRKRGLKDPVLGTTDGAPGLVRAFEECFPKSLRQRCLVHKKRNILGKVPEEVSSMIKAYLNAVYYAPDLESSKREADLFVEKFENLYPSAVKCFKEDLAACLSHLRCPVRHRKSISSTNLLERAFLEEKRRSKVLPRFFDEKSCLKLVFASLTRASYGWSRMNITFNEKLELIKLRKELGQEVEDTFLRIKERRVTVSV